MGDQQVVDQLNLMVATAADLRSQVKQAHWTVVGPNFIALHKLFDEVAEVLLAHVDLYAERVRALQAIPMGTVRNAAECSPLEDLPIGEIEEQECLHLLVDRFESYSEALTKAIELCDKAEDLTTQDIFIAGQQQTDLQAYFLRSHLPAEGAQRGR
ncbi:MAG: DNA starvation/stationary phase protection protein Dps [Dehalococcoidia bacterium]